MKSRPMRPMKVAAAVPQMRTALRARGALPAPRVLADEGGRGGGEGEAGEEAEGLDADGDEVRAQDAGVPPTLCAHAADHEDDEHVAGPHAQGLEEVWNADADEAAEGVPVGPQARGAEADAGGAADAADEHGGHDQASDGVGGEGAQGDAADAEVEVEGVVEDPADYGLAGDDFDGLEVNAGEGPAGRDVDGVDDDHGDEGAEGVAGARRAQAMPAKRSEPKGTPTALMATNWRKPCAAMGERERAMAAGLATRNMPRPTRMPQKAARIMVWPTAALATPTRRAPMARLMRAVAPTPMAWTTSWTNQRMVEPPLTASVEAPPIVNGGGEDGVGEADGGVEEGFRRGWARRG